MAMHEWKPDPDGPDVTGRLVNATEGFASAVHDDIVDALKDWSGIVDPTLWELVVQAVNEIERLRAELEEAYDACRYALADSPRWQENCATVIATWEAHRG